MSRYNVSFSRRKLSGFYLFFFWISGWYVLFLVIFPILVSHGEDWQNFGMLTGFLELCTTWFSQVNGFVCHQISARSIQIFSISMPVCIRCFGMACGTFLSCCVGLGKLPSGNILEKLGVFYFQKPSSPPGHVLGIAILCMLPMVIDGTAQLIFPYDSVPATRFLTGLLFGYFRGSILLTVLSAFFLREPQR